MKQFEGICVIVLARMLPDKQNLRKEGNDMHQYFETMCHPTECKSPLRKIEREYIRCEKLTAETTSLRPEELLCETPAARPLFIKTRFRLAAIRAWKLCPRPEKEQGTERETEGEEAEDEKERAPHPRRAAAEEDDILVATAATDAIVVATNNKDTHTSEIPKKTHL
jgi:hypothetical protein